MPLLEVRICGARNLKDTQIFGKIDPFCTVEFEGKKWHTEAHNNTTNPEWNADFKFHVADENSSRLHFTVWDKNPVSNDFLGEYHYSISGLERGRVDDKWVLLQQCKGNAELHIQVKAVDFGIIRDQYQQQQQGYPQQGYPPQQGHHHHHHHQEQQFNQPPYHGVERVFGRPVRLRTHHGTFVRAYPGRDANVDIKGEHPAEWEQFIIEPHGNGAISIRTHHGTWLRGNAGGEGAKVDTQPDGVREWEEWHIEQAPGGNGWFHLRSHHGTRLRCFPGPDGSRVDLQSNQPGEWERIQIIPA